MTESKILAAEQADAKVLRYEPQHFHTGTPEAAAKVHEDRKTRATPFRMEETIRIRTGLNQLESTAMAEQVEKHTLEKLKEVQEAAYKEAHALGLEEGRKQALRIAGKEIDHSLEDFRKLIGSVSQLRTELVQQHEAHILQLIFRVASRIAMQEITSQPELIGNVVRKVVELAQADEGIVLKVAPAQLAFLESLKESASRDWEFMKNIKLVADDSVTAGGCILENNYGQIDARIEERVSKLWEELAQVIPKTKEKLSA